MQKGTLGYYAQCIIKIFLIFIMLSITFVLDIGLATTREEEKTRAREAHIGPESRVAIKKDTNSKDIKNMSKEDSKEDTIKKGSKEVLIKEDSFLNKKYEDYELVISPRCSPKLGPIPKLKKKDTAVSQKELSKVYKSEEKVAYLTFDDGPTKQHTPAILDILEEENVKATFFVIGVQAKRYPYIVLRQYKEGHGIGNHTYTHAFERIYKNTDKYMAELYKTETVLQTILYTSREFKLTRFPGGSHRDELDDFKKRVVKEGFVYIDWNCQSGDAETAKAKSKEKLIKRFLKTSKGKNSLVILMHDSSGKKTSVEALPEIISYLKQKGYRFDVLPGA